MKELHCYDGNPDHNEIRSVDFNNDDAYWLRRFAGMAMQNLLDRHYDPRDNVGYRVSKCLGRECAEIAVSLLDEIKKHEENNARK